MKNAYNPMVPANAWHNLESLRANDYPGRVVIAGTALNSPFTNTAHVTITTIGGRSADSKNRQYVLDQDDTIKTAFVKPSDADPTNIIYPAMACRKSKRDFVASNGHQTTTILNALRDGENHQAALDMWDYESDLPNSTSRISASLKLLTNQPPRTVISRISKAPEGDWIPCADDGMKPDSVRASWSVPSMPGIGYLMTTYSGNGNPIPAYLGDPMAIPLEGTPEEMLTTIWDALNADTRVAICLRIIDGVTGEFRTFIKNGDSDIVEV